MIFLGRRYVGRLVVLSLVVVGIFTMGPEARAQVGSTAQINGTVRDESGGVLPGVDVTAVQTDTGFRRTVITDTDGSFALTNLPIGPYRLEAALSGFRSFEQTGIVLQVNANPVINVTLSLGQLSETVSVEASAPLVDTQRAGIGEVMENERTRERSTTRLPFPT